MTALQPETTLAARERWVARGVAAPAIVATHAEGAYVRGADGVRYLDIDSETKLDLVRRLNILRTPTVVVTDDVGRIVARTAGVPTKQSLQAVLPAGAS